ncbi:hypothetical protein E2562_030115 [Oryza meyeriana var. granulata]|uniref:Jacalin-type lectin domain-containing protein n=1 Tax=Oryza meyeriana var. granulata TaxID=110450 RepID=A0A6G1BNV7_9ORYZ|nr:hypothetical protein E2562_030115 [Oryza meyeriana var. granulata]KAF0889630.1 hypothetical protein E2562_030115 [Oryza meyeriana var. granulata]
MVSPRNSAGCSSSGVVKVGPWGAGSGGRPWDDGGGYTGIRSITIQAYGIVEAINVEYDLYGLPVLGKNEYIPVASTELYTEKINLNFPDEFLTTVKGWIDHQQIIDLQFKTSQQRTFGPFRRGAYPWSVIRASLFECSVDGAGAIVGFSGRSSQFKINSIALYVATLCPASHFYKKMEEQGLVAYRTSPLCMPRPDWASLR